MTELPNIAETPAGLNPLYLNPDVASKLLVYSDIPAYALSRIEDVINTEEGGFELVDNKWDAGGWTYAGLTHNTLNFYFPQLRKEDLERKNIFKIPDISKFVIEIYYAEFFSPLDKLLWKEQKKDLLLFPAAFSCAVNLGLPKCNELLNKAHNFSPKVFFWQLPSALNSIPPNVAFLTLWMEHYIDLVKENPEKIVELKGALYRVMKYCLPIT